MNASRPEEKAGRMRIGIVLDLSGEGGGIYQYGLTMLNALSTLRTSGDLQDEIIVFTAEHGHPALVSLRNKGTPIRSVTPDFFSRKLSAPLQRLLGGRGYLAVRKLWRRLRGRVASRESASPYPDSPRSRPGLDRWFRKCGAELMLYPAPTPMAFEAGVPYVMAVHDLQHRLQPEFPEVSADGECQKREYLFRNGIGQATLLLADSETGREDILSLYGAEPERVKVLPFLPASYLAVDLSEAERRRVRAAHNLPERYLFYPAQFWPHKNHLRLVRALGFLKKEHRIEAPLILCGGSKGAIRSHTFGEMTDCIRSEGLECQVRCLGQVPDADMSALYAEAAALVMPTFFGPTNIPVLEAWAFGCPVLTSDLRGIREQAGDAAVLVDPRSEGAIAEGIRRLWTDGELRRILAARGRERLATYTPGDYRRRLLEILNDARAQLRAEERR